MTPTFTVVTPTIGRPSLKRTLDTVVPQLRDGDEMLVIGDGPQPAARQMVEAAACPLVHYFEHGPIFNYGNPQRNLAVERASAQWLHFVDDDDEPSPDGISLMRRVLANAPSRPHIFKIRFLGTAERPCNMFLPRKPVVKYGNMSGQNFIAPNIKGRIGRWTQRYGADFDFIRDTLKHYPEGPVWRDELVCTIRIAGPRKPAPETP